MSYNSWLYVYANPVNLTDPSGETPLAICGVLVLVDGPVPAGDAVCALLLAYLGATYLIQHPDQIEQGVDALVEGCTWTWQMLSRLPVREPEPQRTGPDIVILPQPDPTPESKQILYHYSDQSGVTGIVISQVIFASQADDRRAARGHGRPGQYFTDISPAEAATGSAYQLSRAIMTTPWLHDRVTHYVAVNVAGLLIENVGPVFSQTYGSKFIYLHNSTVPLSIEGRLEAWGAVPFTR